MLLRLRYLFATAAMPIIDDFAMPMFFFADAAMR